MKTMTFAMHATKCDGCGDNGPMAFSVESAQREARDRGWATVKEKTLCADCRKEKR